MRNMKSAVFAAALALLCLFTFGSNFGAHVIHAHVAQAQDNTPRITSFTSSASSISSEALIGRRARVPVAWTTTNRSITMNLVFEQVLADGGIVNVELPRLFPWVNSNDSGMTAPTYNGDQVHLRVRLYNFITGETLDQRDLYLPVRVSNDNVTENRSVPAIRTFNATVANVSRAKLADGSARVPVEWLAVNRPIFATLIFEQVLSNGNVVNVELPRDTPWVNSSGTGVVAPRLPSDANATAIVLRVRMYDLLFNRLIDQREAYVAIQNDTQSPPVINTFSTATVSLPYDALRQQSALVRVNWNVANRPAQSNLAFEQVFYDGSSQNIELPRDFVVIPSSGSGDLRPTRPLSDLEYITIRLRVFDMPTGNTYVSKELTIQVERAPDNDFVEIYDPSQCLTSAFLPGVGFAKNLYGKVTPNAKDQDIATVVGQVYLANEPLNATQTTLINAGARFQVIDGPYCYKYLWASNNQTQFRKWFVRMSDTGATGWVNEFYQDIQGLVYNLEVVGDDSVGGGDPVTCLIPYFFTDPNLPKDSCPTGPTQTVSAAFQAYGGGFMLWDPNDKQIYVTYADGTYQRFPDTWDGATEFSYEDAPEGAIIPQRGFGQVFHDHPEIRGKIGWPTGTEHGITSTRQLADLTDANGRGIGPLYITKADGAIVKYTNYGYASGAWSAFQ